MCACVRVCVCVKACLHTCIHSIMHAYKQATSEKIGGGQETKGWMGWLCSGGMVGRGKGEGEEAGGKMKWERRNARSAYEGCGKKKRSWKCSQSDTPGGAMSQQVVNDRQEGPRCLHPSNRDGQHEEKLLPVSRRLARMPCHQLACGRWVT